MRQEFAYVRDNVSMRPEEDVAIAAPGSSVTPRRGRLRTLRALDRTPSNVDRIPAETRRRTRVRSALPAADLLFAVILGALILEPWSAALAYCIVVVPVIGMIEGYAGAPLGGRASLRSVARLTLAAVACEWVAFFVAAMAGGQLDAARALVLLVASSGAWCLSRLALATLEGRRPERVVIVGSGAVTDRLVDLVMYHAGGRMKLLGYVDDHDDPIMHVVDDHDDLIMHVVPQLGGLDSLAQVVSDGKVDRVLVAFCASHQDDVLLDALRTCDQLGVRIDLVPRLFEYVGLSNENYMLGSLPLISVRGRDRRPMARAAKRIIDLVGASMTLVVLSPLFALVALLIKVEDRGPVFFRQARVGRNGERFSLLKFRSMSRDADRHDGDKIEAILHGKATIAEAVASIKLEADPRITRVGVLLRRMSLDELPQLINVVKGDMSLVGPRPLRAFEVEALSDWELTRQLERPGITGLWQVSGRSATTWDERMQLDYRYVRHWSLAEDIEILARTLPTVVSRDGAW